ncbi:hypothetical protein [Deinococcus radiophilus]|uniref:hypothetical protein n=1 Tax=Deinococcus radiophilus TaxID=32062 RepID=UPI001E4E812E|nr:hypothetical protein [Deinococcus radiophilus]UFA50936.1 hypothetical protein LMT64_03265 [Deinococcus radiophilus]
MDPLTLHPILAPELDAWAEALARWRPAAARSVAALRERDAGRHPGEIGERFWAQLGPERVGALELETPLTENQPGWVQLRLGALPEHNSALVRLGVASGSGIRSQHRHGPHRRAGGRTALLSGCRIHRIQPDVHQSPGTGDAGPEPLCGKRSVGAGG